MLLSIMCSIQQVSLAQTSLQEKSNDPDAFRLLGEVKFELKDYEGSVAAYRSASKVSF